MPEETKDAQSQNTETSVPEWVSALPEEARNDPSIIKYKSMDEFYKGVKNLESVVGRKGIIIPTDKSSPEEVAVYRKALGIPDKAEEYAFTKPGKLHSSIKITPEFENALKVRMHARGISQQSADGLFQDLVNDMSKGMEAREQAEQKVFNEKVTALKNEWQNDYDKNIALARQTAIKLGGEKAIDELGDAASNPAALRILVKAGSVISEDSFKNLNASSPEDKGDATSKIDSLNKELLTNSKHPIWDTNHPDHDKAVRERDELYKKAYATAGGKT